MAAARALRLIFAIAVGGAITVALFGLMVWLVTNENTGLGDSSNDDPINFIQYEEEPETRTKDRRSKPEEPEDPPPPPESPEPVAQQQTDPREAMPEMDMPNMDIDMGAGSGPYVGDFSSDAGVNTNATPTSRVPPQYPLEARREGTQGFVTLEFTIRPDGSVTKITVVDSHPEGTFEQEAKRALSRWTFEPKEQDGRKIPHRARQTIRFKLNSG
ncbi:energy transducer TonB [Vreelandella utahensis]|uniref:energy transducer TonB n=1 Tax=Vreelandella halophila TaxID=86177 RepID=UPI000986A6FF|nr:energy transducer TonB [Halomonas utahensis]